MSSVKNTGEGEARMLANCCFDILLSVTRVTTGPVPRAALSDCCETNVVEGVGRSRYFEGESKIFAAKPYKLFISYSFLRCVESM